MRHFIIDGNNLMGKIPSLYKLQKKDGQSSREKLAFILESYFMNKKNNKVNECLIILPLTIRLAEVGE